MGQGTAATGRHCCCQACTHPELLTHLLDKGMCQSIQGALCCCSASLQERMGSLLCHVVALYKMVWCYDAVLPCRTVRLADVFTPARVGGALPATDKAPAPVLGLDILDIMSLAAQCAYKKINTIVRKQWRKRYSRLDMHRALSCQRPCYSPVTSRSATADAFTPLPATTTLMYIQTRRADTPRGCCCLSEDKKTYAQPTIYNTHWFMP